MMQCNPKKSVVLKKTKSVGEHFQYNNLQLWQFQERDQLWNR